MSRKLQQKGALCVFLGVVLVITLVSFVSINFITKTEYTSKRDLLERLSENAYMESTNISYVLQENFTTLETLALFIQSYDDLHNDKLFSILDQVSNNNNYVRISVTDEKGNNCSPDSSISIADRNYFKLAINGKSTVSDLIISRVDGLPCIVIAVPIKKDNKVIGVLRSVLQQDKLNEMLDSDNFSGNEMAYIVQKDGVIVARLDNNSSMTNLFESIGDKKIMNQVVTDFQNGKSGFFRSEFAHTKSHYNYTPIKGSNWYLVNVLPYSIIHQRTSRNMMMGFLLLVEILFILFCSAFVVVHIIRKKNRAIHNLADTIQNITKHVPGGVLRFSADTLEFDFISEGILKLLGYSNEDFKNKYQNRFDNFISPSERDEIVSILSKQQTSATPSSIQYQTENASGQLIWIHNVINLFQDEAGQRWYYAVMVDITDYKQFEKILVSKAENDPLTGLYNKTTTQTLIEKHLDGKPEGIHALFVLDLDNFKTINDTYGHPFGDMILESFAKRVKKTFRNNDIIGRIGGDEFIIYMQSCYGEKYAIEKAEVLLGLLHDISLEKNHSFTFSIGIALYPMNATSFNELFMKADLALYESKAKGKNCYTVYHKK